MSKSKSTTKRIESLKSEDSKSPIEPTLILKPRFTNNGLGEKVIEGVINGEKIMIKDFIIIAKDTSFKVS